MWLNAARARTSPCSCQLSGGCSCQLSGHHRRGTPVVRERTLTDRPRRMGGGGGGRPALTAALVSASRLATPGSASASCHGMSCHVMAVLRCGVAASAAVGPGGSPLGGVVSVGRGVFVSWAQAGIDGAHLQRVLVAGGGLPRGARILNLVTRNRRDVDTISATMDLIKDGHGPLTWQAKNLPLFSISSRTSLRTASCVQYLCCTRDRHSVYRCRPTHCGTSCLPAPPPPKRRCTVAINIRPLSGGGGAL
jgi:hypothetical protein